MVTILTKLEHGHYVMTEAQVESLALERYTNAATVLRADSTYLKGLVVASQARLGNGRKTRGKLNADTQLSVLDEIHERFYAAVLRGVTTEDVASDDALDSKEKQRRSLERNRRSAFARSAKSTLVAYIKAGGDLRTLDVEAVTKAALRKAIAPPEPTDKAARQIERAKGALYRAIARQAKANPDAARETLETAMDDLQKLLDQLPDEEDEGDVEHTETTTSTRATPRDRGPARTRVGVPMLNRGA